MFPHGLTTHAQTNTSILYPIRPTLLPVEIARYSRGASGEWILSSRETLLPYWYGKRIEIGKGSPLWQYLERDGCTGCEQDLENE